MKVSRLHSIRTRLMFGTALLVIAIVVVVVLVWASSARKQVHDQKEAEARTFAVTLAKAFMNELDDENWSQIRIGAEILVADNDDLVYVLVTDKRKENKIIAAVPPDLNEQYVPDVVRVEVTKKANEPMARPLIIETYLLRDVVLRGKLRARLGERIIEVSAAIRTASGAHIGSFRVGVSLRQVDEAAAAATRNALIIGALSLVLGLLGAYLVARRMSAPVEVLQDSARRIADGDLDHRVPIQRSDELGALAESFNEMTKTLDASFQALQGTMVAFKRFVPQKFLAVIAPSGIENIQVGVSATRRISLLFSDIRGYTTLSEGMAPLEVFEFLNIYLARMGKVIEEHGGFIDKFIGDAIMALFDDESTDGALNAALAMRRELHKYNLERVKKGLAPVESGIGIHSGEVVMGTIGFSSRIESTVIGDAVNLASRVEGLTKSYNCSILVTQPILAKVANAGHYQVRLVDDNVKVRGKDEAVAIYELLDPEDHIDPGTSLA